MLRTFDWITPLLATLGDIAHGWPFKRCHTFYVTDTGDWTGHQVFRLLRRYGVRPWGGMVCMGELFFRVTGKQAAWAERVLLQAGVPLTGKLADPRNACYVASSPQATAWAVGLRRRLVLVAVLVLAVGLCYLKGV